MLRDLPGARPFARIEPGELVDLGNSWCIELWLRAEAYPQEDSTPVLVASLRRQDDEARDLVLRLDSRHLTPEFQDFHGPLAPPLREGWTHVALLYTAGRLRLICWRNGASTFDDSVQLEDEHYRLQSIVLASENGACLLFADLRLWSPAPSEQALNANRERPIDRVDDALAGHWRLDEGFGTVMMDSTDRNNHGRIEGGEYLADSGLSLRIGTVVTSPSRTRMTDGRSVVQLGQQAHWKDEPPAVVQERHLDAVEQDKEAVVAAVDESTPARLDELEAQITALRNELDDQESMLDEENASFEKAWTRKNEAVERERAEWDRRRRKILDRLASEQIHLKDFIVQLQDNLTRGRDRIRREHGSVVGFDTFSMDLKVLFGVGGVGLILPDPADAVDPGRLSTVKLRFRAAPNDEEEGKPKRAPVPALVGNTEDFGRRKLAQAGFRVNVVYQEVSDPTQAGRILAQLHDAQDMPLASVITLVVGQRP